LTHPLPGGDRIGLRIADLTLVVRGTGDDALPLDGRADAEVRAWLGGRLSAHGLDPKRLDAPSPYAMPPHPIALGARYSLEELGAAFAALALWYKNAHAALAAAQKKLAAQRLRPPEVRCWPHHFDLDCLIDLRREHSMGVGFSPGDEYCDEPYFYISMYPEPPIPLLPLLPQPGHWHTYQFLAAFAPAHKIAAAHDQGDYVRAFLDASITAALDALRKA
jgi:hypothetical protein